MFDSSPRWLRLLLTIVLMFASGRAAFGRSEQQTILASQEVLQQFMEMQIRQIPESLLAEAHGVAIIPDVIKLGFVVGGQRGHGIVIIRERDGSWRAPLFITITGGSIGWQAGAQSTDFMLVFKSQKSVDGLLRGKFTLGADAAIAAGPVGRRAEAATDTALKAEIYSYSRSRGLFAGVSLEGSALQVDDAANAAYYGAVQPGGAPPAVPTPALKLVEMVAALTKHQPGTIAPTAAVTGIPQPPGQLTAPGMPVGGDRVQHLASVQTDLAASAMKLNAMLDDSWRQYLALPAEIYDPTRRPSAEAVEAALGRFNAISKNRQYQALTDKPEFFSTHRLLQAMHEDLRAIATAPPVELPPPPSAPLR